MAIATMIFMPRLPGLAHSIIAGNTAAVGSDGTSGFQILLQNRHLDREPAIIGEHHADEFIARMQVG